jgi:Domain of unknown function DUF29
MQNLSYENDYYGWANQQAQLLRSGKFTEADIENIAEEIESMGKGEKRELVSRLTVIIMHLLKWQFQPQKRCASWEASIKIQRIQTKKHMRDNPSLKAKIQESIEDAYEVAIIEAALETGLPKQTFPTSCPYSFEQIMDEGFWPD